MAARNPRQRAIACTIAAVERHNGSADNRLPHLRSELDAIRAVGELTDWTERARELPQLEATAVAAVGALAARLDARIKSSAGGVDAT